MVLRDESAPETDKDPTLPWQVRNLQSISCGLFLIERVACSLSCEKKECSCSRLSKTLQDFSTLNLSVVVPRFLSVRTYISRSPCLRASVRFETWSVELIRKMILRESLALSAENLYDKKKRRTTCSDAFDEPENRRERNRRSDFTDPNRARVANIPSL